MSDRYFIINKPYKMVSDANRDFFKARTSETGDLWLMVGTHSGYESFQAIYYTEVTAELIEQ